MSTTLDEMFELVESMNVPEGYHAEIIEGQIVLSPQRDIHWTVIRLFTRSLEDAFGHDAKILSDVRIDFPGTNGYAPDVAYLDRTAQKTGSSYDYRDVQLTCEVVSRDSQRNDYGVKLETYATAGVPTYVIADPYTGWIHVHQQPEGRRYRDLKTYAFGTPFTVTVPPLSVETDLWPTE